MKATVLPFFLVVTIDCVAASLSDLLDGPEYNEYKGPPPRGRRSYVLHVACRSSSKIAPASPNKSGHSMLVLVVLRRTMCKQADAGMELRPTSAPTLCMAPHQSHYQIRSTNMRSSQIRSSLTLQPATLIYSQTRLHYSTSNGILR
jgi:hypothetical protein